MHTLTLYRGLYAVYPIGNETYTWEGLLERFSHHEIQTSKDRATGFGPYATTPVDTTAMCNRHEKIRKGLHRCDKLVDRITLAVFDADTGTEEDVQACEERLKAAGLSYLLYSSFSYPGKVSYRLVLPLAAPLEPPRWSSLRLLLKTRFGIPFDPKKCGGVSHFYFAPTSRPGKETVFRSFTGESLDADQYVPPLSVLQAKIQDLEPTDEDTRQDGILDLAPILKGLPAKISGRRRAGDEERAEVLQAAMEGKPLAEKGSRNDITASTAYWLAREFPEASRDTLVAFLTPSVEAMRAAGSSLTLRELVRMVSSAIRKQQDQARINAAYDEAFRAEAEERTRSMGTFSLDEI